MKGLKKDLKRENNYNSLRTIICVSACVISYLYNTM